MKPQTKPKSNPSAFVTPISPRRSTTCSARRTTTASSDAANTQAQGVTGHKTPGRNLKPAAGGQASRSAASVPAKGGRPVRPG